MPLWEKESPNTPTIYDALHNKGKLVRNSDFGNRHLDQDLIIINIPTILSIFTIIVICVLDFGNHHLDPDLILSDLIWYHPDIKWHIGTKPNGKVKSKETGIFIKTSRHRQKKLWPYTDCNYRQIKQGDKWHKTQLTILTGSDNFERDNMTEHGSCKMRL